MKLISRFLFLFITLFIFAFCANTVSLESKLVNLSCPDSISAVSVSKADILTTRNNHQLLQNINKDDNLTIYNRKSDSSFDGSIGRILIFENHSFNNILAYIYNLSYLRYKSKVLLSVILSEIQPNAP